jgi:hypothetical protein
LNVVPPISKEVALGPVINGDGALNGGVINGDKVVNGKLLEAEVTTLPTHVTHKVTAAGEEITLPSTARSGETRTQRVRRLQEEARSLAREQIGEFELLLDATAKMALEIADGGDVYSIGAREICRRLADELPRTLQTLQVISKKN